MKYLAYGSNMNHKQMTERCPSSKFIEKVKLVGYKFVYDGFSNIWEGSVANIVESKDYFVWGSLFEINNDNLASLDCYEGYPNSYNRKEVEVINDNKNIIKNVIIYYRVEKKEGKPSELYRDVVIKGAHDCGLDKEYINKFLK